MKRIFASLFVVGALVSMGVFASTAYFQTSQTGPGFTLTTGTPSLAVADVGGTLTGSPLMVGPAFDEYACVQVTNNGNYPLNVSLSLNMVPADLINGPALENALDLSLKTGPDCSSGYGTDYLLSAYQSNPQVLDGTLAVGATEYVVMRLQWDAAADQNNQSTLEGYSALQVIGTITGTTPH